jgi:hypothetical protein
VYRPLEAAAAQRAFECGYPCPDALEVLARKRQESHRRACDDGGRPLSRQEELDFAERVAGTESPCRLVRPVDDFGLAGLDEVEGGSEVVDSDDLCAGFDLDRAQRGSELVKLGRGQVGEQLVDF